jgi:hypothetical protein
LLGLADLFKTGELRPGKLVPVLELTETELPPVGREKLGFDAGLVDTVTGTVVPTLWPNLRS